MRRVSTLWAPTARIENLGPGEIMVPGRLTVYSNIASATLWFNSYDYRCKNLSLRTSRALVYRLVVGDRRDYIGVAISVACAV